jgi:crooked neck
MFARFEIRRLDLPAARKLLGAAIGMCPKERLFKGYIELEFDLREFDRVRTLYQKYLEYDPSNSAAWIKFAELETQLEDFSRTRAIFELGVTQSPLSMPELLWKAYIDFEVTEGERIRARELYERLVQLSGHVKVWIAYAMFEAEPIPVPRAEREEDEEDEEAETPMVEGDPQLARAVFQRGYKDLKGKGLKNERVALLEVWKTFEEQHGSEEDVKKVQGMMPIVAKRRHVDEDTGQVVEDWDMVFADDERESNPAPFLFLQNALAWKNKQAASGTSGGSGGPPAAPKFAPASGTQNSAARNGDDDDMSSVASSNEED